MESKLCEPQDTQDACPAFLSGSVIVATCPRPPDSPAVAENIQSAKPWCSGSRGDAVRIQRRRWRATSWATARATTSCIVAESSARNSRTNVSVTRASTGIKASRSR